MNIFHHSFRQRNQHYKGVKINIESSYTISAITYCTLITQNMRTEKKHDICYSLEPWKSSNIIFETSIYNYSIFHLEREKKVQIIGTQCVLITSPYHTKRKKNDTLTNGKPVISQR